MVETKVAGIEAVVLDMDGVVGMTLPISFEAWRRVCRENGVELTWPTYEKVIGIRGVDKVPYFLPKEGYRAAEVVSRKDEHFFTYAEQNGVQPVEGLVELLDMLKAERIPIALATAASRKRAEWLLDHLNVQSYFQAIIASEDVEKGKPNPEALTKAATALKKEPGSCLGIEDSLTGIEAVKRAGMLCIAVATSPVHSLQDLEAAADFVIRGYDELTVDMMRNPHMYFSK